MNFHGGADRSKGYVDYSVNIPPFPLPDSYKELLMGCMDELMVYPEIDGHSAKGALADAFGLSTDHFIVGNGATELIYLMARALKDKTFMILEPTFTEYRRALNSMSVNVKTFDYDLKETVMLNLNALKETLKRDEVDYLFVCNPNNPTGHFLCEETFQTLLRETDVSLIIDESFLDFVQGTKRIPYEEALKELLKTGRLILLRSLTKNYCIPGIRIAYAMAAPSVIEHLCKFKEPWSLNIFAQRSLPYLLSQTEHIQKMRQWAEEERAFMFQALSSIQGLKVFPGEANYFLVYTDKENFLEELHDEGYHIRTCHDFIGLNANYFRVTLRTHEENRAFVRAVEKVVSR